jgi:hypothetical protein
VLSDDSTALFIRRLIFAKKITINSGIAGTADPEYIPQPKPGGVSVAAPSTKRIPYGHRHPRQRTVPAPTGDNESARSSRVHRRRRPRRGSPGVRALPEALAGRRVPASATVLPCRHRRPASLRRQPLRLLPRRRHRDRPEECVTPRPKSGPVSRRSDRNLDRSLIFLGAFVWCVFCRYDGLGEGRAREDGEEVRRGGPEDREHHRQLLAAL